MEPIHLFNLATWQAEWLSIRQKVVAGNIANGNTPGYKARDVGEFSALLSKNSAFAMARTNACHMDIAENALESSAVKPQNNLETTHSGNTVRIEDELRKGAEIRQEMALNTAIIKSFHRMLMASVKGA